MEKPKGWTLFFAPCPQIGTDLACKQDVLAALDLSRATFNRIRLNYFWAMAYNVVMIPFAAGCFYPFTHMQVPPVAGRSVNSSNSPLSHAPS